MASVLPRLRCFGLVLVGVCASVWSVDAWSQTPPADPPQPGVNASNPIMPRVVIDSVDVTEGVFRDTMPEMAPWAIPNYRDKTRDVINRLAEYAHGRDPNFPILIRGGELLVFQSQREFDLAYIKLPEGVPPSRGRIFPVGTPYDNYVRNIAGVVMDQHYCDPLNPTIDSDGIARLQKMELRVLSLERCNGVQEATAAIEAANADGILIQTSIAGNLAFRTVPPPNISGVNIQDIRSLRQAETLLVVLDSWGFDRIGDWVDAMAATNHDVLIVDPFFRGNQCLTRADITRLKQKALGPRRMVFARLSVGLASDLMPYWKNGWQIGNPAFLTGHFPGRTGIYWTDIMNQEWLALIGGGFAAIMDLGVDGIMLDGMTTFLRQEALNPI